MLIDNAPVIDRHCRKRSVSWLATSACAAAIVCATTASAAEGTGDPDPTRQVNLIHNPGFELPDAGNGVAADWLIPGEDQVADWQLRNYWSAERGAWLAPSRDAGAARTGSAGLRILGTGSNTSSVWQRVYLNQTEAKPILFSAWCRFDGHPGMRTHPEFPTAWAAFGIANARHMDHSKAHVHRSQPLADLRQAGGEWQRVQAIHVPKKPLRYIDVKIEVQSAGAAAVLCVDDVLVAEVDAAAAQLEARGVNVPATVMMVPPSTNDALGRTPMIDVPMLDQMGQGRPSGIKVRARAIDTPHALIIEADVDNADADDRVELLFAPYDVKPFHPDTAADMFRIRLDEAGEAALDWVLTRNERHFGASDDVAMFLQRTTVPQVKADRTAQDDSGQRWRFVVPYAALQQVRPTRPSAWRMNLCVRRGDALNCSAPTYTRELSLGTLAFAAQSDIAEPTTIERVEVLADPPDPKAVATFAVPGQLGWGATLLRVRVRHDGPAPLDTTLVARLGEHVAHVPVRLDAGQVKQVEITCPLRIAGRQTLEVSLVGPTSDDPLAALRMPVTIAPLLRLWLYETFGYHDEDTAEVFTWNNATEPDTIAAVRIRIEDWQGKRVGDPVTRNTSGDRTMRVQIPIAAVPARDQPTPDHWIIAEALDGQGDVLDTSRARWGRMKRPAPRAGDPIQDVVIGDRGYFRVNGQPFYAVFASLNVKDLRSGYLSTPRLGFNAAKTNCGSLGAVHLEPQTSYQAVYRRLYEQGTYAAPFCFLQDAKERLEVIDWFKTTPMFLCQIASEVYRQSAAEFDRHEFTEHPDRPFVLEYMNCGSWLDHALDGKQVAEVAMFPFWSWDLSAHRLLVASYARERAVSSSTGLVTSMVMGAGSFDVWDARTTAYLSAIYGGTGAYLYIVADDPEGEDDRITEIARGLATELREMGPIFTAADQQRTIRLVTSPTHLHVGERRINEQRYLIIANVGDQSVEATFELQDGERATDVTRLYEAGHPVQIDDGRRFTDDLPAHWARVYRIDLE